MPSAGNALGNKRDEDKPQTVWQGGGRRKAPGRPTDTTRFVMVYVGMVRCHTCPGKGDGGPTIVIDFKNWHREHILSMRCTANQESIRTRFVCLLSLRLDMIRHVSEMIYKNRPGKNTLHPDLKFQKTQALLWN